MLLRLKPERIEGDYQLSKIDAKFGTVDRLQNVADEWAKCRNDLSPAPSLAVI